jgi:nucleoprotein TPR
MANQAVDITYLSAAFSFPKESFQSLLDAPTKELVHSLLKQLTRSAKEHEITQAEKLKSDIQLESAIRNGESRSRQLKASAEKGLKDVQELREKLNESGMLCSHFVCG